MKKLILILSISAAIITACNTNTKSTDTSNSELVSMSVDDFIMSADSFNDKDIIVNGLVTHVCKHGGQKLFIAGSEEGVSLRIETGENIPEFPIEWEGTQVEFAGKIILVEDESAAGCDEENTEGITEEADCDFEKKSAPVEKVYYMVASSFKNL